MAGQEFLLSLHDLRRTPGSRGEFAFEAAFADTIVTGLTTWPAGRPVAVTGALESAGDGVLVTARAAVRLDAQCSRCLVPFAQDVVVDLTELYVYPEHALEYDDEDVSLIEAASVDLAGPVRDAVILEQPLIPLCRPDCRGLCQCGADLNADPQHDHGGVHDARWSALAQWGRMS